MPNQKITRWKVAIFTVLCLPAAVLLLAALQSNLGPDPAEKLADETGEWALRMLLLTLAISPLQKLTGRVVLLRFRRMLGLFAFFYATVHVLVYLTFLLGWQLQLILQELAERPYITAGFAAFVLLLPLAITSSNAMTRRLGSRWRPLHRLVFPATGLAVLHLWWQQRSDLTEGLVYLALFILLLVLRLLPARVLTRRSVS